MIGAVGEAYRRGQGRAPARSGVAVSTVFCCFLTSVPARDLGLRPGGPPMSLRSEECVQTCDAGSRRSASLPQNGASLLNYFAVLNFNETREKKILNSGPKNHCH